LNGFLPNWTIITYNYHRYRGLESDATQFWRFNKQLSMFRWCVRNLAFHAGDDKLTQLKWHVSDFTFVKPMPFVMITLALTWKIGKFKAPHKFVEKCISALCVSISFISAIIRNSVNKSLLFQIKIYWWVGY